MIRFNFLYWFTLLFCLTSVSAYAQGGAGKVTHPGEMLDYKALLPSSEGAYAEIQPLFGQVTLQACQAGEVRLKPVTLVVPEDALPDPHTVFIQYYPGVAPNDMLPEDVMNLTHQGGHVRMTPSDIYHEGQLLLSIKVEADQLPAWGDAHDIVGLQFSAQTGWSQVNLYQWDAKAQVATFLTDPFAEFIAGIIQTPELSPTAAIVSTEIKDYKTPPPHEGISMIEPPSPNNMGSASLSYPIEIPPGRAGMQPNLSINYNSDGGNGWMGMGWDLSVPSISIDTRWGVPLYDPELETETYTFQGQMLYPVAHRGERVDREANRVFHPRVEGAFAEVIRHGGHPSEYWWEVVNKNGERHYYGGHPNSGLVENGVLKDNEGNICTWFLVEQRDTNGNFMSYSYQRQNDNGPTGSMSSGHNVYIDVIRYTGHDGYEGKYKVTFIRDQQLGEGRRVDAYQDGSMGFKKVVASLLRRIEVRLDDNIIRTYDLTYVEGLFGKTLLDSFRQLDANGNLFYSYRFQYFDDVNTENTSQFFAPPREATIPSDNLKGKLTSEALGYPNETSALGGNRASNYSIGIAVTVGGPGSALLKKNTGGGHYSFSQTEGYGINTLLDLNGDSRPDKVFVEDGKLFIRFNLRQDNGAVVFGEKVELLGSGDINQISASRTESHSYGGEANLKAGSFTAYVSKSTTKTKTTTPIYFQDFNADGLLDIAYNRRVFFNRLNAEGVPTFWTFSSGTPNPIEAGEDISEELAFQQDEDEGGEPTFEEENPLHDAVRVWVVPYEQDDADIIIRGTVRLLQDTSTEAQGYLEKDGVRVSIEYEGEGEPIWGNVEIAADDDSVYQFEKKITSFAKGDMVFFRTHSQYDGAYDQTVWDIDIQYVDEETDALLVQLDANDKNFYQFNSRSDFHLVAPQEMGVPMNGEVRIIGDYTIAPLTDTLHLLIEKREDIDLMDGVDSVEVIQQYTILPGESATDSFSIDVNVETGDRLAFCALTNSNVDWQKVDWNPVIEYNNIEDEIGNIISFRDSAGVSMFRQCAAVDMRMFNNIIEDKPYFIILPDSVDVEGSISFGIPNTVDPPPVPYTGDGQLYISAKGSNMHYGSTCIGPFEFPLQNNAYVFEFEIPFDLRSSDTLFLDVHFSEEGMYDHFRNNYASIVNINNDLIKSSIEPNRHFNIFTPTARNLAPLGTFYRNWGQFSYNGEEESGENVIDATVVRDALADYRENEVQDFDNDNPDELQNALDPTQKPVGIMYANKDSLVWQGYDNLLFVNDSLSSSSRLGEDNRIFRVEAGSTVGGLSAPVKVSRVKSSAKSGGISFSFPLGNADSLQTSASVVDSKTESWQHVDLIDVNKDQYPDIIANGKTQLTLHTGARSSRIIDHGASTNYARGDKTGFTAGGSLQQATTSNTGTRSSGVNFSSNSMKVSQTLALSQQASIGFSGFVDRNKDETDSSWQDVDGDGLPDIINKEGTVRLNYGYYFGSPENWHNIQIRKGESVTDAASASLTGLFSTNKVNGSWTLGVSVSRSRNHSTYGLQDVTGDGFADILTVDDVGNLFVQINMGQQYTEPILWKEGFLLDEGVSVNESINGAFNICINFFFVRICLNPKGYIGRGVSSPRTRIADINGDGFPDLLSSDKDDNLVYHLSKIGRSNKLNTVYGPLGDTMVLDYQLLPSTFEQGNGRWALSSLTINDGYTHDGANTQKTTFEYKDGYKDRREREFYGFSKVISHSHDTENEDAVYRTTIQHYANDTYYRKGLLLADTLMDAAGALYTTTEYEYELRAPLASSVQTLPNGFSADDSLAYPAQRRMSRAYYEGQAEAGLIHTTRYDYDLKGNTILYTDEGSGAPEEEVQAVIQYHSLDSLGIYSIPRDMQVIDYEGTVLRHRACEVYPENGNIKTIRQYYTSAEAAVFDYEYDDYGNITKVTRPENINGERMTYEFTYDDEVNTYVVATNDAYGYSSSATYDYRFGVPLTTTDLNDNQMVFAYDTKGRLTHLTGPYELASGAPYTIKMEYFPEAEPAYSICRHYNEDTNSDILTVTFVDGLGRPVQVKKSGLLYQSSAQADQAVMNVSGKIIYDAFGREVATYYPVSEAVGDTTAINTQEDTEAAPTEVTYDVLDRKLKTTLPDATETVMHYEISDPPGGGSKAFATFTEDALGNTTEVYTDVRGRQLSTVAYGPDGPITTSFTYNAIAEVLTVSDVAGNTTKFTYDMLGRQTSIDHPVNGLTELFYDPLGNITRKLTANLRDFFGEDSGILYDYDYERPIRITYPLNYQNKVEYVYGSATDSTFNRRGKVVLQRDASGAQEFFYGPMGEITKTIRTVVLNPTEIRTYVSEARYDSWNRIQQLFYPDGEVVDYAYNAAGKLTRLSGERLGESYAYVNRISYDKFEKRRYIQFGNNTEQEYQYDPDRQWLDKMKARTDDRDFMDVDYAYDAVANILSVTNTQEPEEGQIGGAYTHNYTYDELYRIYSAEGSWVRGNRQEAYTLDMEFDNTHNILSKNQVRTRNGQPVFNEANYMQTYQYEAGRPFVPSKVGRFQYDHDLNGNLLSVTDTTSLNLKEYEWDEENRLTAVIDNGYVSHYTYDATGERVIKSHGPVTGQAFNGSDNGFIDHRSNYTAYINPEFVARQGSYTKHYFIEGQRICSKIGQGQFNNNSAEFGQGTLTAGSIDYVTWLSQVRANELDYYGDSLTVSHPTMPFRYVVPDSTGEAYPDLLPDAIVVTTPQSSIYVLPAQPDLSGNSQAGAPAWGTQNTLSADSISAGYGMTDTIGLPREVLQYFYHSDHVGSTAYITDRNGNVSQYAVYTAFGELFVEDQLLDVDDSQPYLFNGKELDRETGLYYYGARYYEPISSMWMSVDPLANKYPGWSPYCYTMLNPVGMVDPDGRASKRKMTVAEEVANHRSKVLGYQQELGLSALSIVNDFATGHSDAWTSGNTSKAQRNLYGEKYMADTQSDIYQVGKAIGGVTNALSGAVGKVLGYASDAVSMFDDVVNDKSEQALATFMGTLMSSITDVSLDHGKVDIEQPVRDLISWVIGESFTGLTDPNSYKPKENTKND